MKICTKNMENMHGQFSNMQKHLINTHKNSKFQKKPFYVVINLHYKKRKYRKINL